VYSIKPFHFSIIHPKLKDVPTSKIEITIAIGIGFRAVYPHAKNTYRDDSDSDGVSYFVSGQLT
jgi:hypothetical protein